MSLDERALAELTEESQDLHSDATRITAESLDELVDEGRQARASKSWSVDDKRPEPLQNSVTRPVAVAGGILAATGFAAALAALASTPAYASSATDIQILQTAASIENLAISTYTTALTLPYIGGSSANPVVKAFVTTTLSQHRQHDQAFSSAIKALGGAAQNNPDPKYVPIVNSAVASITKDSTSAGLMAVVDLAMTLENVAAETYVNNCSMLSDSNAKAITASIMGVEAQHVAVLSAVKALLAANAPQLIALSPTVVNSLPAAAGSVGFPNAFYPISSASPASEGAVS